MRFPVDGIPKNSPERYTPTVLRLASCKRIDETANAWFRLAFSIRHRFAPRRQVLARKFVTSFPNESDFQDQALDRPPSSAGKRHLLSRDLIACWPFASLGEPSHGQKIAP